jgi:hypothetical protein
MDQGFADPLVWNELKLHINPSEVDSYARRIGLARISRNEEALNELLMLRQMQNTIESNLSDEIEKKNPPFMVTAQRTCVISRAIKFLDSLRDKGHIVDPENPDDSQILKYLKYVRASRPNSSDPRSPPREPTTPRSSRMVRDIGESVTDLQNLIDDEYSQLQSEIQSLRTALFSSCEELNDVKGLIPPTTESIETFTKKMQKKEEMIQNVPKARKPPTIARVHHTVKLKRFLD